MGSINTGTCILWEGFGRWGKVEAACDVRTVWFSALGLPSIGQFPVEKMDAIEHGLREQRVLSHAKLLGV